MPDISYGGTYKGPVGAGTGQVLPREDPATPGWVGLDGQWHALPVNTPSPINQQALAVGPVTQNTIPNSIRPLAQAAGYTGSGGYTPSTFSPEAENERIRNLTGSGASGALNQPSPMAPGGTNVDAQRQLTEQRAVDTASREDDQAFQLQLAQLRGTQSLEALQKQADLKTQSDARISADQKAQQDRMLALITPWLNQQGTSVAPTSDADATAAQDAAFARAKDRTAQIARSSLMALRSMATERGVNVAGGTNPALLASEGRLAAQSAQPLSDLVREQAIESTQRAQSVADRNYQGAITQRGQNNALVPSLLSLLRVGGVAY